MVEAFDKETPLSLTLFIIVMEVLSQKFHREVVEKKLDGYITGGMKSPTFCALHMQTTN